MTWDQLKKWCVLYGPSLANFLIINLKFNEWLSKWSIYRYMRLTCARLCQIRPRVTRPHLPLAGLFGDRCRNLFEAEREHVRELKGIEAASVRPANDRSQSVSCGSVIF